MEVIAFIKEMLATFMILLSMFTPALNGGGVAFEAENPDKLITSFAVVSDIHVETNNSASYSNLDKVLKGIKAGKNIDTVVYTGDNVMNGQITENVFFYSALKAAKPAKNNFVITGNHDLGNGAGNYENSSKDFIANNNFYLGNKIDKLYYYRIVNGCYMIFMASEDVNASDFVMSREQFNWLEGVLKEAQEAGAPIFVFNHFPIRYLDDNGTEVYRDELAALFVKYGVDLFVHGHIHDDLGADNFYTWGGVSCINLPRITEITEYEAGDGIVVEVYENEFVVKGRDFIKGEWIEGLEYRYAF